MSWSWCDLLASLNIPYCKLAIRSAKFLDTTPLHTPKGIYSALLLFSGFRHQYPDVGMIHASNRNLITQTLFINWFIFTMVWDLASYVWTRSCHLRSTTSGQHTLKVICSLPMFLILVLHYLKALQPDRVLYPCKCITQGFHQKLLGWYNIKVAAKLSQGT